MSLVAAGFFNDLLNGSASEGPAIISVDRDTSVVRQSSI